MGTSFLLCSPFPFLMALQFRRQTHTCTSPTGFNDNTLTKAYGSGLKQTRRNGNSSGNQRGYKGGAIVVFEVGCKFIPVYLPSTAIMAELEALKEAFIPSPSSIIYRLEMKFGNGGWEIIMEEILLEWRGKGAKQKHKGCLFTAGWGFRHDDWLWRWLPLRASSAKLDEDDCRGYSCRVVLCHLWASAEPSIASKMGVPPRSMNIHMCLQSPGGGFLKAAGTSASCTRS